MCVEMGGGGGGLWKYHASSTTACLSLNEAVGGVPCIYTPSFSSSPPACIIDVGI